MVIIVRVINSLLGRLTLDPAGIRGVARNLLRGGQNSPPLTYPTLLSPPFPPLRSRPLKSSYGVWGSAVSSPSGVWGGAPAEIDFGAF